jgi:hypothetical protein
MSLFRSPQVPQQPPQYFTPGLPLGIPRPHQDMQLQQSGAYYRQRPDNEAAQLAAGVTRRMVTTGQTVSAPKPRQSSQDHAGWRQRIEVQLPPTYNATASGAAPPQFVPSSTPQNQATWRSRYEILQPQTLFANQAGVAIVFVPAPDYLGFDSTADEPPQQPQSFAVQSVPQAFVPAPALQMLPSNRWALEWIVENYSVEFTPGFTPAAAFVPAAPLQIPSNVRWPIEWIVENYGAEFTPGLPLGVPAPRQSDQSHAIWRSRVEIQQPQVFAPIQPPQVVYVPHTDFQMAAYFPAHPITVEILSEQLVTEFTQSAITPFVPAPALQMPFAQATRNEWSILLLQQRVTTGIPRGTPQPRQGDQTAAYYRQHVEIQQPIYFAYIAPIPLSLRRDEFVAGRDQIRYTVERDVEFSMPREKVKFSPT